MSKLTWYLLFVFFVTKSFSVSGNIEASYLATTLNEDSYIKGVGYSNNIGLTGNLNYDNWKFFHLSHKISVQSVGYSWESDSKSGNSGALLFGVNPIVLNFRYQSFKLGTSPHISSILKRFNEPENLEELNYKLSNKRNVAVGIDIDLYYQVNNKSSVSIGLLYRDIYWVDSRTDSYFYGINGFKFSYIHELF